jgi:riboflavin synthase
MFTGIVEAALAVEAVQDKDGLRRITLDLSSLPEADGIKLGDSIALNGCCLTVAALDGELATFEAIPETLKLTNLGGLKQGSVVNVERALKAGSRFDGHFVQGHVDRVGKVAAVNGEAEWRVRIDSGREFAAQCIHKGSVCIDGISLTIAELGPDWLTVAIIPHTREVTNIRGWKAGTPVNLEADMIGKYVRANMGRHGA